MRTLSVILAATLAVSAFAPNDREKLLTALRTTELYPGHGPQYEVSAAITKGQLPPEWRARVIDALYVTLRLPAAKFEQRSPARVRYRAALDLDLLEETGDEISSAILDGMISYFPLSQGYYRGVEPKHIEDIRRIRVRTGPIVDLLIELARHAGDRAGQIQAFLALGEWHGASPASRWINWHAADLLTASASCIEYWHDQWTRNEQRGTARGAAARARAALQQEKEAERAYRQFLTFWPRTEHTKPDLRPKPSESDRLSFPSADVGPIEHIYSRALDDEEPSPVEQAVDILLGLPTLSFETLVKLDNVRTSGRVRGGTKAEIESRLRRELAAYSVDMTRFEEEDPARVASLSAMDTVDPLTKCLLFLSSQRLGEAG